MGQYLAHESDQSVTYDREAFLTIKLGETVASLENWKDRPVKYLRDQVIEQLKYNLANDHLEIEEFEQMVRLALSTRSKKELMTLTSDLPVRDTAKTDLQLSDRGAAENITSILSSSKRKGIWIPSKQLNVKAVMGEAKLDFREADLGSGLIHITINCLMGEVQIVVPPGVNVISNVQNFLGAVNTGGSEGRILADSPTIVLEGKVILGDLSLKIKNREAPK